MYTTDQMHRFIELRARGLTVPTIAVQLGIPSSTLYDWNNRARHEIQKIKRIALHEVEERVLGSHECQLDSLARVLKLVDNQIASETYKRTQRLELPSLVAIAASLRRQIHALHSHALPPLDTKPDAPVCPEPDPKP
ncbi:MAG TPA: helix-turn-helix domain-containing protein [Verrucomicrobiae bacterium]|nr:helix-turn-helix domain-containing protein [Verrucomicrobiae bacterium]